MKITKVQFASILVLLALFTVPSLAFPNSNSGCYRAELTDGETVYGYVRLVSGNNKARLEVVIESSPYSGEFEVTMFKDYYSDYIAGNIEIVDGNGEATFDSPFREPDFHVIIDTSPNTYSSEWVECEPPIKPDSIKVSPSTLNLKSLGNWITITVRVSTDPMPINFELKVGDSDPIEPEAIKVTGDHITLKFSRKDLQSICSPGEITVTITFDIEDDSYELSDTIRVINEGGNGNTATVKEKNQVKTNNSKANGKNKGN